VELVLRWIKIGLAFSRLVDQKAIGENKRRHQNKGKTWIVHRYWHKIWNKKWTFASGKPILSSFSDTKIERFRMAKLEKNPYLDREYFEKWRMKRCKFFPPTQQVTLIQFFG